MIANWAEPLIVTLFVGQLWQFAERLTLQEAFAQDRLLMLLDICFASFLLANDGLFELLLQRELPSLLNLKAFLLYKKKPLSSFNIFFYKHKCVLFTAEEKDLSPIAKVTT